MERKTIGSFIAALRKAKGLTQQEVAERLCVSNKTVSKWECDDGLPEITIIPAIAELFEVTADEILKGERKTHAGSARERIKCEKQIERLISVTAGRFKNNSYIAFAVTLFGVIWLFTVSYVFYRPILGFGILTACIAASFICELIFLNNAKTAVSSNEPIDGCNALAEPFYKTLLNCFFMVTCSNISALILGLPFVIVTDPFFTESVIAFDDYIGLLPQLFAAGALAGIITRTIAKKALKIDAAIYSPEQKKKLKKLNRGLLIAFILSVAVFFGFIALISGIANQSGGGAKIHFGLLFYAFWITAAAFIAAVYHKKRNKILKEK
ncbi:MAG: helix-turn-helix transcriptional regulator [Christensenellales bacterium]